MGPTPQRPTRKLAARLAAIPLGARTFASNGRRVLVAALVGTAAACTGGAGGTDPAATVEPGLELRLVEETAPASPLHIVFDWRMREGDATFDGKGAARVAPPYRARLDLFGPRGETYLAAGLVDQDLSLPAGADALPIPPAELLWAALGVFVPPPGADPVRAERVDGGDAMVLAYVLGDRTWTYRLEGMQLRHVQLDRRSRGRETIELGERNADGVPTEAVYRQWAAFRELVLTPDDIEHVENGFPEDIWYPHAF